jgi:hypothetical protein
MLDIGRMLDKNRTNQGCDRPFFYLISSKHINRHGRSAVIKDQAKNSTFRWSVVLWNPHLCIPMGREPSCYRLPAKSSEYVVFIYNSAKGFA